MFTLRSFLKDESGATAVEYALIAAGIGVAVAGAVSVLGSSITNVFAEISCTIDTGKVWTPGTAAVAAVYGSGGIITTPAVAAVAGGCA